MVGLDDFKDPFQDKQFYDSTDKKVIGLFKVEAISLLLILQVIKVKLI